MLSRYPQSVVKTLGEHPLERGQMPFCRRCLMDMDSTGELADTVRGLIDAIPKEKRAPLELADMRLAMCEGCEYRTGITCRVCGCFVVMRASIAQQACPRSRW